MACECRTSFRTQASHLLKTLSDTPIRYVSYTGCNRDDIGQYSPHQINPQLLTADNPETPQFHLIDRVQCFFRYGRVSGSSPADVCSAFTQPVGEKVTFSRGVLAGATGALTPPKILWWGTICKVGLLPMRPYHPCLNRRRRGCIVHTVTDEYPVNGTPLRGIHIFLMIRTIIRSYLRPLRKGPSYSVGSLRTRISVTGASFTMDRNIPSLT